MRDMGVSNVQQSSLTMLRIQHAVYNLTSGTWQPSDIKWRLSLTYVQLLLLKSSMLQTILNNSNLSGIRFLNASLMLMLMPMPIIPMASVDTLVFR